MHKFASWQSVNGGIIIIHDGNERGARTAEVLDRLIPILKARGYRFGELQRPGVRLANSVEKLSIVY